MHFKPMTKEQKKLVKGWLAQDYVGKYWYGVGLQNTLHSIEKFISGQKTPFTIWIAYDGTTPFGYLMTSKINPKKDLLYGKYCDLKAKAITLDLLIGNRDYLGKGLSHLMIHQLLLQEFSFVTDVFIDPSVDNPKAIHVYEKAGFQKLIEFVPPWEPDSRCVLMYLKMEPLKFPTSSPMFKFKALTDVDRVDVIALMQHPKVICHMPLLTEKFDEPKYKSFIAAKEKMWKESGYGPWAFIQNGTFMGWGGLQPVDCDVEIALVLHPNYWGYGKALYEKIIQYAFEIRHLKSVIILFPTSRTRIKAIFQLGFRLDGKYEFSGKQYIRYRLSASEAQKTNNKVQTN
jgi:RimJ/RimL family protein N-acetyltransferase